MDGRHYTSGGRSTLEENCKYVCIDWIGISMNIFFQVLITAKADYSIFYDIKNFSRVCFLGNRYPQSTKISINNDDNNEDCDDDDENDDDDDVSDSNNTIIVTGDDGDDDYSNNNNLNNNNGNRYQLLPPTPPLFIFSGTCINGTYRKDNEFGYECIGLIKKNI